MASADVIEAAPFQLQLKESDLSGLEIALGNAHGQLGQVDEAVTAFNRAFVVMSVSFPSLDRRAPHFSGSIESFF